MTDYTPTGVKHELLTGGRRLTEIFPDGIYTTEGGRILTQPQYGKGLAEIIELQSNLNEVVRHRFPTDAEITNNDVVL